MALDQLKLKNLLLALTGQTDPIIAAQAMAGVYADYCSDAVTLAFGALGPVSVAPGRQATQLALVNFFIERVGSQQSSAPQFTAALAAFWPVTQFKFTAPAIGPGVCTPPAGTQQLSDFILALVPVSDAEPVMTAFAAAIDGFSKTVVVTFPTSTVPLISSVV